jgi:hypothetical protein
VTKQLISMVVLALTAATARAQSPDGLQDQSNLTTLNCKEVFSMSRVDTAIVLAYLQAHYRAKDALPIIDTRKMAADGLKLKEYCDENPQKSVIEAADELFGLRL